MRTRFDCRRRRNPKISSSTSAPSLCTARTMFCGRRTLLGSVEEGERVGGQLVIWAQRGREHEVAEARGRRGRGAQTGSRGNMCHGRSAQGRDLGSDENAASGRRGLHGGVREKRGHPWHLVGTQCVGRTVERLVRLRFGPGDEYH